MFKVGLSVLVLETLSMMKQDEFFGTTLCCRVTGTTQKSRSSKTRRNKRPRFVEILKTRRDIQQEPQDFVSLASNVAHWHRRVFLYSTQRSY